MMPRFSSWPKVAIANTKPRIEGTTASAKRVRIPANRLTTTLHRGTGYERRISRVLSSRSWEMTLDARIEARMPKAAQNVMWNISKLIQPYTSANACAGSPNKFFMTGGHVEETTLAAFGSICGNNTVST